MSASWVEARARHSPSRAALVTAAGTLTWAQLAMRARHRAAGLLAAGLLPGDTFCTLLPSSVELVELVHGATVAGVTICPLGERLTAAELTHPVRDSRARLLVHGDGPLAERAAEVARSTGVPTVRPADVDHSDGYPDGRVPRGAEGQDVVAVIYTSGTSGAPRGAELTAHGLSMSALATASAIAFQPDDRWLACLPLHHVGGLSILTRGAVLGGTVVLLEERFDEELVLDLLRAGDITVVSLVPTMLQRLLEAHADAPPPPALRCVLLGGAHAPPALVERAWAACWPVCPTYGLTEASSQVSMVLPDEFGRVPAGTVGRPLLTVEVEVRDAGGEVQPAGTVGELFVRGPILMRGYRGAAESPIRDGWLATGDLGHRDEEGFLFVVDRRTDLIVTGGENVYPSEVEEVLRRHPAIRDVAAGGIPDPDLGTRVAAWVELVAGVDVTAADLVDACRRELAGFKLPRVIFQVDELPRTASGKVRHAALDPDLGALLP